MLADKFGRNHTYLRIALTERCNLRCSYCMPEEGIQLSPKYTIMNTYEIIGIAKQFVNNGITKIRLTGGEPLVRKNVDVIIAELGKLGVDLGITTNAILANRYIDVFKKANLKSINISLDTLKKDRFFSITKRKEFERTLNNIDLLYNEGFHLKINVVVTKGMNADEIIDFIELTKDRDWSIRFIEFMPFNGNKWEWDKIYSYKQILDDATKHYGNTIINLDTEDNHTAKRHQIKGYKGNFAVISSMTDNFCSSCNRLRLTANGKMKNCLFSTGAADLLTAYRNNEDLTPIINTCLLKKQAKHGGIKELQNLSENDIQKRSMILIGG